MDLSDITRLISSLRAQTARDSITPNGLGSILQRIVDAISSMSGIDVEDEEAILQRLSAAESNASTALQAAQNAQAGAAGNVIDSFTQSQDEDEVSLSIKQHGHSARQVVLPAASSTGAGIMTATDKSHLDTAYGKRVNLMSAPSSESVVTLTITFGDGTTKSVTFVGATAGTGGKAGLMTKEQADQLAALVAAGPAESVRDDAGYLKQQYAAPIILRNVTDTVFDDLAIGDVYYDTGHLFYHAEGASGDPDIGAPSRKVIYYCLADQTLYRWTGSRFVQAVSISSGDVTVPTKLSDLINDMGFLTAHQPLKTINGQTITGTGNITIDGAAELKDASNHIKQNSATPVVLRNVAETMLDDLNEGDVYFDSGHLFWHTESSSGDIDLGTPSKRLVYFCLGNSNFYRWGGSSFTKINMPAGTTPHIDSTTGNWFIGTTNTGVHAQGPQGNTVVVGGEDEFLIVNNLTTGGEGDALSAEMGKTLMVAIQQILGALGNYAFPGGKPTIDWGGSSSVTYSVTYPSDSKVTHTGAGDTVELGSLLEVTLGIASGNDLYVIKDSSVKVYMSGVEQSGAYNASTQKVTLAAVTGNVVIVAEAWTYFGYNDGNTGLELFLDGKNGRSVAHRWDSLVNYNDLPLYFKLENCDESNSDYVGFDKDDNSCGIAYSDAGFQNQVTLLDVPAASGTIEFAATGMAETSSVCVMHNNIGSGNRILFAINSIANDNTKRNVAYCSSPVSSATNGGALYATGVKQGYFSALSNSVKVNGVDIEMYPNNSTGAVSFYSDTTGYLALLMRHISNKTPVDAYYSANLYALRVYSVQLTDVERAQNLAIDRKRFNLGY